MGYDVRHAVDPIILGKAAEATGAAGTIHDDTVRSLEAQQRAGMQAAGIAANQANLATQLAAQNLRYGYDKQFEAQTNANALTAEDAWRKRALEFNAQQQREHDAAVAEMNERDNRAKFVQQGLKDGKLYFDPKSNERLSTLQAQRAEVARDPSIAPDVKQKMLQQYDEEFNSIYSTPSVRHQPQQAFHETVEAGSAFLDSETGKPAPIGSRPLKKGDYLIQPSRDGFRYVPFDDGSSTTPEKPKTLNEYRGSPAQQQRNVDDALRRIQESYDAERKHAVDFADGEFKIAQAELNDLRTDRSAKPETVAAARQRFADATTALRDAQRTPPKKASYADALRLIGDDETALRGEVPPTGMDILRGVGRALGRMGQGADAQPQAAQPQQGGRGDMTMDIRIGPDGIKRDSQGNPLGNVEQIPIHRPGDAVELELLRGNGGASQQSQVKERLSQYRQKYGNNVQSWPAEAQAEFDSLTGGL